MKEKIVISMRTGSKGKGERVSIIIAKIPVLITDKCVKSRVLYVIKL